MILGAGSVLQQMVAHGGNTQPPLFRAGMTSSVFLPPQFKFNDEVPEVRNAVFHQSPVVLLRSLEYIPNYSSNNWVSHLVRLWSDHQH